MKITASIAYLSSKKIKNFVINSFIADWNTKIISFKLFDNLFTNSIFIVNKYELLKEVLAKSKTMLIEDLIKTTARISVAGKGVTLR